MIAKSKKKIGTFALKSHTYGNRNLDWAICVLDQFEHSSTNQVMLQNDSTLVQVTMMRENPKDATIFIHYGAGIISGFILSDYSLVALPGQKLAQRMWIVILDEDIRMYHDFLTKISVQTS